MKQAQRTRRETRTGRPWKTDCAIRRDRLTILLWIKFVSLLSSLRSLFQLFTILSLLWPLRRRSERACTQRLRQARPSPSETAKACAAIGRRPGVAAHVTTTQRSDVTPASPGPSRQHRRRPERLGLAGRFQSDEAITT
ncbi:hypothetical protein Zmor_008091 [Zophobas morio]|nr:hypothetical protein Zmor_008091 [Zophobas morio]